MLLDSSATLVENLYILSCVCCLWNPKASGESLGYMLSHKQQMQDKLQEFRGKVAEETIARGLGPCPGPGP